MRLENTELRLKKLSTTSVSIRLEGTSEGPWELDEEQISTALQPADHLLLHTRIANSMKLPWNIFQEFHHERLLWLNCSVWKTSQVFKYSSLIQQQTTNRKVPAMTTGKQFPRRTSMNTRETGTRNSSQQKNARLLIMFNLPKAYEIVFSTCQRQSVSPLNGKLGTGQPYAKDMALLPLQHSW